MTEICQKVQDRFGMPAEWALSVSSTWLKRGNEEGDNHNGRK